MLNVILGAGNPRQSLHNRAASLNGPPTDLLVVQGLKLAATNLSNSVTVCGIPKITSLAVSGKGVCPCTGVTNFSLKHSEDLRSKLDEIDCDPFYDSSKETGFVQ
jgi:hypothetical protein